MCSFRSSADELEFVWDKSIQGYVESIQPSTLQLYQAFTKEKYTNIGLSSSIYAAFWLTTKLLVHLSFKNNVNNNLILYKFD